eukprot:525489-Amphidinium_carterae.1
MLKSTLTRCGTGAVQTVKLREGLVTMDLRITRTRMCTTSSLDHCLTTVGLAASHQRLNLKSRSLPKYRHLTPSKWFCNLQVFHNSSKQ